VRSTTLWARLLGLVKAVVEDVCFDDDDGCIVVSVRPRKATKRRCGRCGKRCAGYDQGEGRRRWRALDLGTIRAYLTSTVRPSKMASAGWSAREHTTAAWPLAPSARMAVTRAGTLSSPRAGRAAAPRG